MATLNQSASKQFVAQPCSLTHTVQTWHFIRECLKLYPDNRCRYYLYKNLHDKLLIFLYRDKQYTQGLFLADVILTGIQNSNPCHPLPCCVLRWGVGTYKCCISMLRCYLDPGFCCSALCNHGGPFIFFKEI